MEACGKQDYTTGCIQGNHLQRISFMFTNVQGTKSQTCHV